MTSRTERFLDEHAELSRRYFLGIGAVGAAAMASRSLAAAEPRDPALQQAIDLLETWLTAQDDFQDVSRGNPKPHSLTGDAQLDARLTRDTWKLEVVNDPDHPARLRSPLTIEDGTALDFEGLMALAEKHAVRFSKVMTCLNIGCPLGTGIWEGVPLREVLWMTEPRENLRRVFFWGFHNNDESQMFRSSLPVGRVLEDPPGLPPVILCYKLNGHWLTPERGAPVRIVVPEAYGFKSIKWLTTVVLSNIFHANDTYGEKNNDVDSPLKSFAATLLVPDHVRPGQPIPITGYAQVGISGLSKVQVWLHKDGDDLPEGGRYYANAPWVDAEILSPPSFWGGDLADDAIPESTMGFDADGQPLTWPMRLNKVHWAAFLPGVEAGEYTFRCRTVDDNGIAQPMPRPFKKSGHAAIEQVGLRVETT